MADLGIAAEDDLVAVQVDVVVGIEPRQIAGIPVEFVVPADAVAQIVRNEGNFGGRGPRIRCDAKALLEEVDDRIGVDFAGDLVRVLSAQVGR